jgi:hypothetical protein
LPRARLLKRLLATNRSHPWLPEPARRTARNWLCKERCILKMFCPVHALLVELHSKLLLSCRVDIGVMVSCVSCLFLPIFKLKCRQPSHSSSACALEDPATMMLSQCGGHRRAGSKPEIWSFRTGHALDIQRKHCFPMFSNCFPVFFTESFFHCPLETGGFGGNSSPCRRWANLWWEDTTN